MSISRVVARHRGALYFSEKICYLSVQDLSGKNMLSFGSGYVRKKCRNFQDNRSENGSGSKSFPPPGGSLRVHLHDESCVCVSCFCGYQLTTSGLCRFYGAVLSTVWRILIQIGRKSNLFIEWRQLPQSHQWERGLRATASGESSYACWEETSLEASTESLDPSLST